ncbi:hypothetical protein LXL04_030317 [Taraxacum kok-saghyz]
MATGTSHPTTLATTLCSCDSDNLQASRRPQAASTENNEEAVEKWLRQMAVSGDLQPGRYTPGIDVFPATVADLRREAAAGEIPVSLVSG